MFPFLNNGSTIDSVQHSGYTPLSNKALKNLTRKSKTKFDLEAFFNISPIMPSGPAAFLFFNLFKAIKTSSNETGRFKT